MCGKLSSTSRLTAICLMSSMPVVFGRCCSGVLSGWKASGMKVWKPRGFVLQGCEASAGGRRGLRHSRRGRKAWCAFDFSPIWWANPGGIEPVVAVDLVVADDVSHAVSEDFCAAARKRIHACAFICCQGLADRELGALRKIRDLDHRERLQMNLREALLSDLKRGRGNTETADRDAVRRRCETRSPLRCSRRRLSEMLLRAPWCRRRACPSCGRRRRGGKRLRKHSWD